MSVRGGEDDRPDAAPPDGPLAVVVVGTRPEAIKMAPVVRALRRPGAPVRTRLLLTGQHTDLVAGALATFGLDADRDLAIMEEGQSLYDVAAGCLAGLRQVVDEWGPDLILVQGDTATVFFAALAGYFDGVATGHVEAGLRSGDLRSPFPEEGFRRLTAVLADLHFAPTPRARENLRAEGVPDERIHVTGNTVVDALLEVARRAARPRAPELAELLAGDFPFALLTAHRRESFGEPLRQAFRGVIQLLEDQPRLRILYPIHPNPRVKGAAIELLGSHPRVRLVDPLCYEDLVLALRGAALVLTDSGGIQEEAPTFGTPVLVLREVTERPEGIEAGVCRLVGTDPARILKAGREALGEPPEAREMRRGNNPFGDGQAGLRIARVVEGFLATGRPREGRPA